MKKSLCVLVIAALLAGCSQSNEDRLAGDTAEHPASSQVSQENNQPGKAAKLEDSERMQGLKKMKEELRAKGINPDHPTNEDFRKALTGGRE